MNINIAEMEVLKDLSKKNNILRISAEKGMTAKDAISAIKKYSPLIKKCRLPKQYYSELIKIG